MLAVLDQDSSLYVAVPVKYHTELVSSLISKNTGLASNTASTIAGRIENLYLGIGCPDDSSRIQIAADGSFPSFAVGMALSKGNGWSKKTYTAESTEALDAGWPNSFPYYTGTSFPYKISFPTQKEMVVAKKIGPMLENYASRLDSTLLDYYSFVNLDGNTTRDILFYAGDPSRFAAGLISEMAATWFVSADGKISRLQSGDYSLSARLHFADRNRKKVVVALMSLAGIPVNDVDETAVFVSNIKVSKKQIESLVTVKGF